MLRFRCVRSFSASLALGATLQPREVPEPPLAPHGKNKNMSRCSGQRGQHASTTSLQSNHKPLRRCRGNPPPLRSEPTLVSSSVCGPAHATLCLLKARRMRSFSFLRGVQQWLPQERTQRTRHTCPTEKNATDNEARRTHSRFQRRSHVLMRPCRTTSREAGEVASAPAGTVSQTEECVMVDRSEGV